MAIAVSSCHNAGRRDNWPGTDYLAVDMSQYLRREFGDFQTPLTLARDVCALLVRSGIRPKSILEPTCGRGSFLVASLEHFSSAETILAFGSPRLSVVNLGNSLQ